MYPTLKINEHALDVLILEAPSEEKIVLGSRSPDEKGLYEITVAPWIFERIIAFLDDGRGEDVSDVIIRMWRRDS